MVRNRRVSLTLLGDFRLEVDGAEIGLSRNSQRVLALLGLRARLTRAELAGVLWPEVTQARAQANLRSALWRLGRTGADLVAAFGDSLQLQPDVLVDVCEWTRLARGLLREQDAPALPDAPVVPTHIGELLPGWYDDWVLAVREPLRQLHLHVLEVCALRLLDLGRYALAVDVALQAVCADPLRESAHRLVIRIHLAEGNVSEARRQFATCRQLLAEELGVSPSPDLLALVACDVVA